MQAPGTLLAIPWQDSATTRPMCANYQAIVDRKRLERHFLARFEERATTLEYAAEIYPVRPAPFVRLVKDGTGVRRVDIGLFGLLPFFAKEISFGRRTYNARSETVDRLTSFKHAWSRGQRCIIPAEAIYEPCYESGRPVRWAIRRPDEVPMGIAGIWADSPTLKDDAGEPLLSFAMLTVNGEGHPVFQRMHAPEDEKRMVVILDPADYARWLECPPPESQEFFRQYGGTLTSQAAPRLPAERQPNPAKAKPNRGSSSPPG